MFLADLKPVFDKFNSINNIDSEIAMKIVDECATICKSLIKKFKFSNDICWKLRYLFGILYILFMKNKKFCQPSTSNEIKELLLNEIDIKKEILLHRLKQKSKIGIVHKLPNHVIDYIVDLILQ
jgi:hypothetical protein